MHKSRKVRLNKARSEMRDGDGAPNSRYYGKTAVIGVLDRDARKVRARVVPNVKRKTLQEHLLNQIAPGSKVYTDQALASDKAIMAPEFVHEMVNHIDE